MLYSLLINVVPYHVSLCINPCIFLKVIFLFLEFQEFMKPDKDEHEYYKSVGADRKNSCETPVLNTKLLNGQRKVSNPCISLTKLELPVTTSRQQRIKSVPLVRHLSHQLTSKT